MSRLLHPYDVEQIAAGNAGWRLQFRFAVRAGSPRVPQLPSIGLHARLGFTFLHNLHMIFPSLRSALADYFGEDAEIESPEDESDAWRLIVDGCRHGSYPDLQSEIGELLLRSDQEICEFLRSCAPAWEWDDAVGARRSLQVFQSYLDAYAQ